MNNRVIKFRAWDRVNNAMLPPDDMGYQISVPSGDYFDADVDYMQFIGYTDVNGKEVYEGDIISAVNKQFGHAVVEWSQAAFWLRYYDKMYKEDIREEIYHWAGNRIALEVIGNIYQNPELLTP